MFFPLSLSFPFRCWHLSNSVRTKRRMKRNRRSNRQQVVSNFLFGAPCQNSVPRRRQQFVCWHGKDNDGDWPMYRWEKLLLLENKNSISITKSLIKLVPNSVWATNNNKEKMYRRTHSQASQQQQRKKRVVCERSRIFYWSISASMNAVWRSVRNGCKKNIFFSFWAANSDWWNVLHWIVHVTCVQHHPCKPKTQTQSRRVCRTVNALVAKLVSSVTSSLLSQPGPRHNRRLPSSPLCFAPLSPSKYSISSLAAQVWFYSRCS